MVDIRKYELLRLMLENDFSGRTELEKAVDSMANPAVEKNKVEGFLRQLSERGILRGNFGLERKNLKEQEVDRLAFVLWCRHRRKNWKNLMSENCAEIYGETLKSDDISLQRLIEKTGFSQPTVSKYLKKLREEDLLEKKKGRPLIVSPRITDVSIFYANAFNLGFENLENSVPELNASSGVEKIEDEIAKIHIFSSARTEGNTASRDDVERVLQDLKLHDITATETLEIMDLKRSIDLLRSFKQEEFSIERLVQLNAELLKGTEDGAGEIMGGNDISGTRYNPPQNVKTVRISLESLCNFLNERMGDMKTEVLAGISHFLFVSIHPFVDGNGRTGRLLHSWVLMKDNKPMFIYDPRLHRDYKELLEEANFADLMPFLRFCVEEHQSQLDRLEDQSREPIFEVDQKTKDAVEKTGSSEDKTLKDFS